MNAYARAFGDIYAYIRNDIFKWCRLWNFTPTWQQAQLLGCVQRGDRWIAVRSGQGPGKTTCMFIIASWLAIQAENAQIILTAPTMRQCRDGFLAEGRRLLPKADPLVQKMISISQTKLTVFGRSDWGIKTVTATDEKAAQGMHQENQCIIGDEASGIRREIIEQFKGTSSNAGARFFLIGNPNLRDCAFFDCFYGSQAKTWTKLHWNAEETPHEVCSPERNWRIADEYGRDSDVYRVRVLGEFPRSDPNAIMSSEDLQQFVDVKFMDAASRILGPDGRPMRQFGLDFARGGGDENTLFQRQGNAILQWSRENKIEPGDMVDRAFKWQHDWSWLNEQCLYVPDATGIGQGVMRQFYRAGKTVHEFHNHHVARDPKKYANKITEAYFEVAKKVKSGDPMFIGKDADTLIRQLSTRLYAIDKKGRIIIEDKPSYVKRVGESPDRGDGFVMAMYDHAQVRSQSTSPMENTPRVGESVHYQRRMVGEI